MLIDLPADIHHLGNENYTFAFFQPQILLGLKSRIYKTSRGFISCHSAAQPSKEL